MRALREERKTQRTEVGEYSLSVKQEMQILLSLSALALAVQAVWGAPAFNPNSLTKYNVFVKTPASKEPIQTGGRLIERHISYLAQAGFKSILSVVEFATNDTAFNGVNGSFPSTEYETYLANAAGLEEAHLVSSFTVDSARQISSLIDSLPKPLFVHCHVGYQANLFVQLHLYIKGEILASDIYPNSLHMGYDYLNNTDVVSLVNSLTGRSDVPTPERIESSLGGEAKYKSYFWTHRLGDADQWYNAGQILSSHLAAIQSAGYRSVVSFRVDGEDTARLPTEPTTGPIPNDEFSDAQGLYRAELERQAVEAVGLRFVHLPLDPQSPSTWTAATFFHTYLPVLHSLASQPVLTHCASGYRSAALVLTYQAYERRLCADWVAAKARQVGFVLHGDSPSDHDLQVLDFAFAVLGC